MVLNFQKSTKPSLAKFAGGAAIGSVLLGYIHPCMIKVKWLKLKKLIIMNRNVTSRQIISNAVKRKACEDILERPAKLINLEMGKNPFGNIFVKDMNCIRRNMYIARRKTLPAMPKNLKEVIKVSEKYGFCTN